MLEGRGGALCSRALPALQMILQLLKLHLREVDQAARLASTAAAALSALDGTRDWRPLLQDVIEGSAESVEDLSRLLLPSSQGIDTVQRPDGTWAASFFHAGVAHEGSGASEVEAALDAIVAVVASLGTEKPDPG